MGSDSKLPSRAGIIRGVSFGRRKMAGRVSPQEVALSGLDVLIKTRCALLSLRWNKKKEIGGWKRKTSDILIGTKKVFRPFWFKQRNQRIRCSQYMCKDKEFFLSSMTSAKSTAGTYGCKYYIVCGFHAVFQFRAGGGVVNVIAPKQLYTSLP